MGKQTQMKVLKLKMNEYVPKNYTGIIEYSNGDKFWYKEGLLHRADGPAVEYPNGSKEWYKEGLLHRLDGPAVEWVTGIVVWYIDGKEYYRNDVLENGVFLGIEKGRYDLPWLRFFTEKGIEMFPIVPGMEKDKYLWSKIKEIKEKNYIFNVAAENIR